MDIKFCIGSFETGQHDLLQRLLENEELLRSHGIYIPSQQQIAHFVASMRKDTSPNAWNNAKQHICPDDSINKALLISPAVSGVVHRPAVGSYFFPNAKKRLDSIIANIPADIDVNIYYSTRDPASFIPGSYAATLRNGRLEDFETFVDGFDFLGLRWSNLLHMLQSNVLECKVHTWAWESYAASWKNIAQQYVGADTPIEFAGEDTLHKREMSLAGAEKMYEFLLEEEDHTQKLRDKIYEMIAKKHPGDVPAPENDLWPDDFIENLTHAYEDDLYYIGNYPAWV